MRSCVVSEPRISRRSTDSASAGEIPSDSAVVARPHQHLALAAESRAYSRPVSRFASATWRLSCLALGDQRQQLSIKRTQARAQFFERHRSGRQAAIFAQPFY